MSNEEKILSVLEALVAKVDKLEQGQAKLEQGQNKLEQGQADIIRRIDVLEEDLRYELREVWKDISINTDSIKRHEKEFHRVGV